MKQLEQDFEYSLNHLGFMLQTVRERCLESLIEIEQEEVLIRKEHIQDLASSFDRLKQFTKEIEAKYQVIKASK
jgi:hypothetical protein